MTVSVETRVIHRLVARARVSDHLISLPKVQTAICFSNPDSDISWFRDSSNKIIGQRPWEQLKVLTPGEITEWASCVRFGLPSVKIQGNRKVFDQLLLEKEAMIAFATNILNVREWLDIQDFLPTETYAYLYPLDDNNSPGISIKDREITVGRVVHQIVLQAIGDTGVGTLGRKIAMNEVFDKASGFGNRAVV